jgi:hypothetical protein
MIYGNWVAIRKVFARYLPDDRPYSKLEAVVSVSMDFDSKNPASYSGYSKLWGWSRNKVKKFMDDLGLSIESPETPEEIRLQKGKIKGHPKGQPQDNLDDKKRQPLFVYNKALYGIKDNLPEEKGQPRDTPKDTTIDPIKIPNPKKNNTTQKPENVTEQTWHDILVLRKSKKAPLTERALKGIIREAEKAGWSIEAAFEEMCLRGWTGFKAEWVENSKNQSNQQTSFSSKTNGYTTGVEQE